MKYSNVAFKIHLVNGTVANELNEFVLSKTEPFKHTETDAADLQTQITRFITLVITQGVLWKIGERTVVISPSQIAYVDYTIVE